MRNRYQPETKKTIRIEGEITGCSTGHVEYRVFNRTYNMQVVSQVSKQVKIAKHLEIKITDEEGTRMSKLKFKQLLNNKLGLSWATLRPS